MGRRRSLESSQGEWDSWGAFIDCRAMNNCRRVESEQNNNEENGQDRVMLLIDCDGKVHVHVHFLELCARN